MDTTPTFITEVLCLVTYIQLFSALAYSYWLGFYDMLQFYGHAYLYTGCVLLLVHVIIVKHV